MKKLVVTLLVGFAALPVVSAVAVSGTSPPTNPSVLPAGVYTTRYFLPGMRVTVPAGGWRSSQDSPTEFKLNPPNDNNAAIRFWIDPNASTPCSDKVVPVDISSPTRAVAWLRGNKNLLISNQRRATISGHLALRVDLDVKAAAPKCSPDCPGPCLDYFLFHQQGVTEPFGTGRGELVRLYFAQIGPPSHLFVVGVDTPDRNAFATLTASATRILADLRLPPKLPPRLP